MRLIRSTPGAEYAGKAATTDAVKANPEKEATEELEKIEIDGKVYKLKGGSSMSYKEIK